MLREVRESDLADFFEHQREPEATEMALFPARDREAFDAHWKRILRETPERLWWWMPLRALDRVLTRIPLVRWLAWNVVMWGEKATGK